MTEETQQSLSPSEVGPVLGRRNVIKGAAALGGVAAFGGVLAACGSDEPASAGDDGTGDGGAAAASGVLRVGSNYSNARENEALKAALDAFPNKDVTVELNEVDHNTWEQQIVGYMQDPSEDVAPWFASNRLAPLASAGLLMDISDVWTEGLDSEQSEGFKAASTYDGKQYFVPWTFYSWAIYYRKSVWESVGATPPGTYEELLALCETLDGLGVTPFALGNDGFWPAQGTFDQLNFRLNGYQYHIDLIQGRESWTDQRTKDVFAKWAELLPYHQSDANGRAWEDAAATLVSGESAMMTIGGFVGGQFPEADLDDLDFFPFPVLNDEHGLDTVEAPIDGWVVVANPDNEAASRELVAHMGTALAQDAFLAIDNSVQAASSNANTAGYSALQAKSSEMVQGAKNVTQFLNRDTLPAFADEAGQAFADFLADPTNVDAILDDLQGKAEALL